MTNTRFLAVCCLALSSVCLFSCASNSVNMKPDAAIAADIVATPSPVPSSSPEPTPAAAAPAATPQAQPAPAASGRETQPRRARSRQASRTAAVAAPAADTDRTDLYGSCGQGAVCGAGSAPLEEGSAAENSAQPFWTPTPIAQAAFPSQAQPEAAAAGSSSGWLLAGLALLAAVAAVLLTYRRLNQQNAKNPASEHPARMVPARAGQEPSARHTAEPLPSGPAETETQAASRPEPAAAAPAAASEPVAAAAEPAEHKAKTVRRTRKPAAKPRTVKAAAKPAGKNAHRIKNEVRKKAA